MVSRGGHSVRIQPIPAEMVDIVWEDAIPLLSVAINNSENEVGAEYIRTMAKQEIWDLWIATRGEKVVGAAVLELLPSLKGTWLNIVMCGVSKDLKALDTILKRVEEIAKLTGCCGVKWISKDRRFGAYAERQGYRERFREYVKEY